MFSLKKKQSAVSLSGLLLGLGTSILLFLLGLIIVSFLVNFINISSHYSQILLAVINYSVLFIGGLIAAYSSKNKGWLNGALVGISYIICLFVVGHLTTSIVVSTSLLLRTFSFLLTSTLGGVIGINMI